MIEYINHSINYVLDKIIYPVYDYTTSIFTTPC